MAFIHYRGLSTDSKPIASSGDDFLEMDSGKLFIYGGEWYEQAGGGLGTNLITDEIIDYAASASINTSWEWKITSGKASKSLVIPVSVGKDYAIKWDSSDASVVGNVFRYGFTTDPVPSSSNIIESPRERTTPQDKTSVTVTASAAYLVIEVLGESDMPGSYPNNVSHLSVCEKT